MTRNDIWIRTAGELEWLVDELRGCRAIGFDTESDNQHHYREQICLVQLTGYGRGAWLVDPLVVADLTPLAALFEDPTVVKVVHGGDNDVPALGRDFGLRVRTLFDTALAARLLGDTELGLQALVRNELGLELTKGSQRDDWSRRPLTATQEAYALGDVAHLMALAARLTTRLAAAGRTEWAREEFAALADQPRSAPRTGPEEYRRMKGAGKLSRRQLGVLRELHLWREARAAAADRPAFKIVATEVLVDLAARPPTKIAGVARALARFPREADQADALFAAIARGLALPEDELPARQEGRRRAAQPAEVARIEALRAWRDATAERLRLDPSVVLPQKVIERLAAAAPRAVEDLAAIEGLRRWRVAEWGDALLAACAASGASPEALANRAGRGAEASAVVTTSTGARGS